MIFPHSPGTVPPAEGLCPGTVTARGRWPGRHLGPSPASVCVCVWGLLPAAFHHPWGNPSSTTRGAAGTSPVCVDRRFFCKIKGGSG